MILEGNLSMSLEISEFCLIIKGHQMVFERVKMKQDQHQRKPMIPLFP